jgi:hypothetical protein
MTEKIVIGKNTRVDKSYMCSLSSTCVCVYAICSNVMKKNNELAGPLVVPRLFLEVKLRLRLSGEKKIQIVLNSFWQAGWLSALKKMQHALKHPSRKACFQKRKIFSKNVR